MSRFDHQTTLRNSRFDLFGVVFEFQTCCLPIGQICLVPFDLVVICSSVLGCVSMELVGVACLFSVFGLVSMVLFVFSVLRLVSMTFYVPSSITNMNAQGGVFCPWSFGFVCLWLDLFVFVCFRIGFYGFGWFCLFSDWFRWFWLVWFVCGWFCLFLYVFGLVSMVLVGFVCFRIGSMVLLVVLCVSMVWVGFAFWGDCFDP